MRATRMLPVAALGLATVLAIVYVATTGMFAATSGPRGSDADLAPDLQLRFDLFDTEIGAGDVPAIAFHVANTGLSTATGVHVDIEVPEGVTFLGGAGCSPAPDGRSGRCNVADLAPGASASHALEIRYDVSGHPDITGVALLDQPDANPDDNHATLNVTVLPAPPPGLVCTATREGNLLDWGDVRGAHEYSVYKGPDLIFRGLETRFLDRDVTPGEVSRYRVTWFDGHFESVGARCEVVAIPYFPGLAAGALAGVVAAGAYVALRRRT